METVQRKMLFSEISVNSPFFVLKINDYRYNPAQKEIRIGIMNICLQTSHWLSQSQHNESMYNIVVCVTIRVL